MFLSSQGTLQQKRLAVQATDTGLGELAFRVSRQIQQLGECIYVCFTIQDDQALQAIPGIFRRLQR